MVATLYKILPFIGAATAAFIIFLFGKSLSEDLFKRRSKDRVKDLVGVEELKDIKPADFGSKEYKIRLAFARFNIDVYQHEKLALNALRIIAAIVFGTAMHVLFNLPWTTSSAGSIGGILLVNSFAANAWVKLCNDIDKEIPIFLSGFTSTIQVNPNVLQAVEEEAMVLAVNSPLKRWLIDRFVRQGQELGISALDELIAEAFRVSNSLGVMVFLIGRLWRTGGMEWRRSFGLAAQNLEGVMEARVLGLAAGSSAKNAVKVIIGVTMMVIMVMARNPIFSTAMEQPIVQIVYALATLMMIFGFQFMSNMIERLM